MLSYITTIGKEMKKNKLVIYGCPHCKKYLCKCDYYKYCMYCGKSYDKDKLIILKTITWKDFDCE